MTLALTAIILAGCENSSVWQLTSGSLSDADPDPIVFEGDAVLIGWGVAVPYYAGTPELHFHVAPESLKNLPQNYDFKKWDWNFKLINADKDFIKVLSESNQGDKAEVLVNKLTIVQEGHPLLYLTETPKNSTSPQIQ